jgi:hypothetical protein
MLQLVSLTPIPGSLLLYHNSPLLAAESIANTLMHPVCCTTAYMSYHRNGPPWFILLARYALARGLGPGTCLRSDAFEAGGQAFQLEVFPAGAAADCSVHLSLFLTSPSGADSPNHVLYELAVVDQVRSMIECLNQGKVRVSGCHCDSMIVHGLQEQQQTLSAVWYMRACCGGRVVWAGTCS